MVWGCGFSLDVGTAWEHPGRKQGRQKKKKMRARGEGERRWVESAFFLRSWPRKAATSSGSQLRTDLAPVVCTHTCDGARLRVHTCARAVCSQPASVLTWPRPSPQPSFLISKLAPGSPLSAVALLTPPAPVLAPQGPALSLCPFEAPREAPWLAAQFSPSDSTSAFIFLMLGSPSVS